MAGVFQGVAQRADQQRAHTASVAEAHLGLGGVNVDVDLLRRQLDEEREQRIAAFGDQVAVGGAHGADQQLVFHRPAC